MDDKEKSINQAIKQIEDAFGEGTIQKIGDHNTLKGIEWIPTGSFVLDKSIGQGLPRGRIIEIFGPEQGGKSSISLLAISMAQKLKGKCAYIDAEGAFDISWANRLGVNTDELYFVQPDYGEQALEVLDKLVCSGACDIIVVDSVAALVPKSELEGDMGAQTIGLQARLMSKALRKITMNIRKTKTIVIFINQTRQKIGTLYGNPETTTGGTALGFYASVRIRVSRDHKADVLVNGETIAHRINTAIPKNKVSSPFKKTSFLLYYDKGVDNIEGLVDTAITSGLITQSGPSYILAEKDMKWFGEKKLKEAIVEDKELQKFLIEKMKLPEIYLQPRGEVNA